MKHKLRFVAVLAAIRLVSAFFVFRVTGGGIVQRIKIRVSLLFDPINLSEVSSEDDDWQLVLVNAQNSLPENFSVELAELSNGQKVDKRIYPQLRKMFDDARAEGVFPSVTSAFRTEEKQRSLLEEETEKRVNQGESYRAAREAAKKWVAEPGHSEHQTGLALDINSADETRSSSDSVHKWLIKNSYKYGFILRYPEDKVYITGIANEPWHFRYVGAAAAKEIHDRGLCLEEYIKIIRKQSARNSGARR